MNEKLNQVLEMFKQKTKKQCYSITLSDEKPSILDSKIGGKPYMRIGETYPQDSKGNVMPLFIQINFDNFDLKNYPKKGLLQLFVDKDLSYPSEYKVKYIENINEPFNEDLPEIDTSNFIVQEALKVDLSLDETYMPINDFRSNKFFCEVFNEVFGSNIDNFYDSDAVSGIKNGYELVYDALKIKTGLIGGYADFTQNDPRNYDKSQSTLLECLIKIDSSLDMNRIMIGDVGIAWLLISEEDLKAKQFENAKFDWDCC